MWTNWNLYTRSVFAVSPYEDWVYEQLTYHVFVENCKCNNSVELSQQVMIVIILFLRSYDHIYDSNTSLPCTVHSEWIERLGSCGPTTKQQKADAK